MRIETEKNWYPADWVRKWKYSVSWASLYTWYRFLFLDCSVMFFQLMPLFHIYEGRKDLNISTKLNGILFGFYSSAQSWIDFIDEMGWKFPNKIHTHSLPAACRDNKLNMIMPNVNYSNQHNGVTSVNK